MKPQSIIGALILSLSTTSFADTLEQRHLELAGSQISALRVTLSQNLEVIYRGASTHEVITDSDILERFRHQRHSVQVSDDTLGGIVGATDDLSAIWVSFDSECRDQECAFGFVATQSGYLLATVPKKEGLNFHTAMIRNSGIQRRRWYRSQSVERHFRYNSSVDNRDFLYISHPIRFVAGNGDGREQRLKLNISSEQIVEFERTAERARGFN